MRSESKTVKQLHAGYGKTALRGPRAVYALKLLELFTVDFRIGAKEVEMRAQGLPLALLLYLLLGELVALAFVNMKNLDLHVLTPAWQIRENRGALTEIPNHIAANVTTEDGARERILEQDLNHLFYS